MAKFKNENGEEFEAFTQEELDAAKKAAVEEAGKVWATEKATLEDNLKKEQDKDKNFGKLKEDADTKINALTKELTDLKTTVTGNVKNDLLAKLSGGDKEIKDKIELEYGKFAGEANSKEEIETRMLNAFRLAVPDVNPGTLENAFSWVGARSKSTTTTTTQPTETEKKIGENLGVSEADRTKYDSEVNSMLNK